MNRMEFMMLCVLRIAKTNIGLFLRTVLHRESLSRGVVINVIAIFFAISLSSCSVSKLIPEGKSLIVKNHVYIHYNDSTASGAKVKESSLEDYIPLSQTPNSRFFGMDYSMWLYMQSNPDKDNWWNNTLRKIGQEPRYYSAEDADRSKKNMNIYMSSIGYLDNTLTAKVEYNKKGAIVRYDITPHNPYYIDSVWYNFEDKNLAKYILQDSSSMLIKKGNLLTRDAMIKERQRISKILNNKGFYTFTINDIDYLVDTTHATNRAFVQLNINKRRFQNRVEEHKIYKINNIFVYPNFNGLIDSLTHIDTVRYNNVSYLYQNGDINIKTKPLSRQVRFAHGDTWLPEKIENTNSSFLNMKYYKTASIDFDNIPNIDTTEFGYLDSYIRLVPAKIHGVKADGEISSNANYTSIIARMGYSNKNIFKHSETFDISFNAGYDLFYNKSKTDAYQFGVKTSLSFPKLVVPFVVKSSSFIHNIESKISFGYDIQNRPDYRRNIFTTTFGYKWSNGKQLVFLYNPVSISYIGLPRVSEEYLGTITNPYLKNTYTDQLIAGTTFGVLYNKEKTYGSNYTLKANFETAGNTLYLGAVVFNQKRKTSRVGGEHFTVFGERYAQYIRADVDFSYKYNFLGKSAIVARAYAGIGTGYGNSITMPFERSFYAGGNASMRGWQIRALGPGGKTLTEENLKYPNSLGDIRLEMNLEGRFPIIGPIHGAVFLDVGNIWSNGKGETDKSAIFYFDKFYKQLAFNTGAGIRLDLDFFVIRLDWGIILHNPNNIAGQRWIRKFNFDNTALHFAIGYPF